LKDSKGRQLTTVVAGYLSDAAQENMATAARAAEDKVLQTVSNNPGASIADLAKQLSWMTSRGEPHKSKVQRAIKQLQEAKLVSRERGRLTITDKGKGVLKGK
jgi:DNA-binding MarR family transcriptional regulator